MLIGIAIILSVLLLGIVVLLPRLNAERYLQVDEDIHLDFPFKTVFDENNRKLTRVVALAAPFREKKHEELYERLRKAGKTFIGISSYLNFPNKIHNPHEDRFHEEQQHNYPAMCKVWLHCFRNPENTVLFQHLPHLLVTEADLVDVGQPSTSEKEYDFMYICLKDNDQCTPGWQSYNRNWEMAKVCLEEMCEKYRLRGILVGRTGCEYTDKCNGLVKTYDFLPYDQFQAEMKKCRFLFVPNVSDASPRVITEALRYNMPVLCNYHILGGWHNIIPGVTGEFFRDPITFAQMMPVFMHRLHAGVYRPRDWFVQHRGKLNSGRQLAQFLKQHLPSGCIPSSVDSIFIQ